MEQDLWMGLATIVAVFVGPTAAVFMTRVVDDMRLRDQRRFDVFRTLMRTRRMHLNPDHVAALNLVEIEFQDCNDVLKAFKDYYENLGLNIPPNASLEDINRFTDDRDALLTKLLDKMSKKVKVPMEQLEIHRGGYIPQGWAEQENEQRQVRLLLIQLLSGNRAIPVVNHVNPQPQGPFPPVPD